MLHVERMESGKIEISLEDVDLEHLAQECISPLRPLFDAAYRWFARNRLRLTGREAVCDDLACTPPVQAAVQARAGRDASTRAR